MNEPNPASNDGEYRSERAMDVGLVLWPSFLAACGASMLFFAAVDPALLRDAGPRLFANLDREAGYALGFFFFWARRRGSERAQRLSDTQFESPWAQGRPPVGAAMTRAPIVAPVHEQRRPRLLRGSAEDLSA